MKLQWRRLSSLGRLRRVMHTHSSIYYGDGHYHQKQLPLSYVKSCALLAARWCYPLEASLNLFSIQTKLRLSPNLLNIMAKRTSAIGNSSQELYRIFTSRVLLSLPCNAKGRCDMWMAKRDLNQRYSTASGQSNSMYPQPDFLSFFGSMLFTTEGPSHRWLNWAKDIKETWDEESLSLVAINIFLQNDVVSRNEHSNLVDNLKLIQQRFPNLHVLGFQHSVSFGCLGDVAEINKVILKEFITFPVLLTSRDFSKVVNGAFYLLFEGFKSPVAYDNNDMEVGNIFTAINSWKREPLPKSGTSLSSTNTSTSFQESYFEFVKEPMVCNFWRELLLSFPGAISADECGQRIFISDTNHHRIIIADTNGHILDCIGSSPGFQDGPFESAKICRPAGSIFTVDQDCLYFADSENHAIRKADMEKRIVQTLYPPSDISRGHQISQFIRMLMQALHLERKEDTNTEKEQISALKFPWHLVTTEENDLVIVNQGFGNLWFMSMETGEIRKPLEGVNTILELFKQKSVNKMSVIDEMVQRLRSKQKPALRFLQGLTSYDLLSSIAKLQNVIMLADTDGQRILKLHLETGDISLLQFSNLGILGLPYWWSCAVERLFAFRNGVHDKNMNKSHHQSSFPCFHVRPGRYEIQVNLILPSGTKLEAPLNKGCIWRQARGAVVELSTCNGMLLANKIGVAQQWYDEIDNLAFSSPFSSEELGLEDLEDSDEKRWETNIHSIVDVNRGVGEVFIDTAVYLTLDTKGEDSSHAINILDILDKDKSRRQEELCFSLLSESCTEHQPLVFMKHAHVRIRLKCSDDAPPDTSLLVDAVL